MTLTKINVIGDLNRLYRVYTIEITFTNLSTVSVTILYLDATESVHRKN